VSEDTQWLEDSEHLADPGTATVVIKQLAPNPAVERTFGADATCRVEFPGPGLVPSKGIQAAGVATTLTALN
jgi:hypothetical protein